MGVIAAGGLVGALISIPMTVHMQRSAADDWSATLTFAGLMLGGAVYLAWLWWRLKP